MKINKNTLCMIFLLIILIIGVSNYSKIENYTSYPELINTDYNSWIYKASNYTNEMKYQNDQNEYEQNILKNNLVHKKNILGNNKFKPKCCPAPYSSSNGCACITEEQIDYLSKRANNIVKDTY